MENEEVAPMELMAARCVSFRELSRSTSGLMNEIERDGKIFAVSRYGRLVALLVPLPERLIIEFENDARTPMPRTPVEDQQVDLDSLELTELACEFLIDAASTPTGFWHVPESALLADQRQALRTLNELDLKGLTAFVAAGLRRITKEGRAVAAALKRRGRKGYEEAHNGIIAPRQRPREGS